MKIYYNPPLAPFVPSPCPSWPLILLLGLSPLWWPGQNETKGNINNEIIQNYEPSLRLPTILTLGAFNIRPSFNKKESRKSGRRGGVVKAAEAFGS